MDPKNYLKDLFHRTLDASTPFQAVEEALSVSGQELDICGERFSLDERPVYVWAVGKAAVSMFNGVHQLLGDHIAGSLVIAPKEGLPSDGSADQMIGASHPLPDDKSEAAGKRLSDFARDIPDDALVLSLISGGTSALVCYPAEGLSVDDISSLFELLNRSGATIREINTVRKHCSRIKGGRLLGMLPPKAAVADLIISDVPGNDPATVGSGPTTPDDSTSADARNILDQYNLWEELPPSVRQHLEKKSEQEANKNTTGRDPAAEHHSFVISSAEHFAEKAKKLALKDGIECIVADEPFNGPVDEVSARIAKETQLQDGDSPPKLFLFYGESTVKVTGPGKGGRNQEMALHGALKIAGESGIGWLCAGTDGVDGPTDAAGAIVDGQSLQQARKEDLDAECYLDENDSYHFHRQAGTLLKTGPTGNNLMDVVWVLHTGNS